MTYKPFFPILFIVVIISGVARAQSTLSLYEAIRIALENQPKGMIASQQFQKSKMALEVARSELYPRLDLVFNNRYMKTIEKFEPIQISITEPISKKTYTVSPSKDVPDYQTDFSLQLTKNLYTGGRISEIIKEAKAQVRAAEINKLIQQRAIILFVINAYWELKQAEKIVNIYQEKVTYSESILEVARKRYEKGALSGLEREKAEVDFFNNRGDLLYAKTAQKKAEDILLREMGIIHSGVQSILTLTDEPYYTFSKHNEETVEKAVQKALVLRPELTYINSQIWSNKAKIGIVRADYFPQVDIAGYYNCIGYSRDTLDDAWADLSRDYWAVKLIVKLNLFEGFATRKKIDQVSSELSVWELEMEKQKQIIIQEVQQAYNCLIGAAERIILSEHNITLAEKNLKAAKRQFEVGAATINLVAEYNLSLAETRERYINALIDFEIAKAKLQWAIGEELF
ncbi:MAG: TolC family protein [bacterium]